MKIIISFIFLLGAATSYSGNFFYITMKAEKMLPGQSLTDVAQNKTDKLAKKLGLSSGQKKTVFDICVASLQSRQELLPLKKSDKKDFDTKMSSLANDTYKKITDLLNAQQKKKLQKLRDLAQGGQVAF